MGKSVTLRLKHSQMRRRSSSALRMRNEREILLLQSRSFRDFEALFVVLDAMEQWKAVTDQSKKLVPNLDYTRIAKFLLILVS